MAALLKVPVAHLQPSKLANGPRFPAGLSFALGGQS